jgi:hypothetical protein
MRHHPKFFVLAIILILLGTLIPLFPAKADSTYVDVSISPNFQWSRHSWKIVYWNDRVFEVIFWCYAGSTSSTSYNVYIFELNPSDLTFKSLYKVLDFTTSSIVYGPSSSYAFTVITTAISSYQNYLLLWIYEIYRNSGSLLAHALALYTFDFSTNTTTPFSGNPIFNAAPSTGYIAYPEYARVEVDVGNLEIMGQGGTHTGDYDRIRINRFYAVVTSLSPLAVTGISNVDASTGKTDFVPYALATFSSGTMRYVGVLAYSSYYMYWTFDTSTNAFGAPTVVQKKIPIPLLENWKGSSEWFPLLPEYQFIPISYNPSNNVMTYQLAGTYYIGSLTDTNKPYQSQYSVLQTRPTVDTSTVDTYYVFTDYEYFIGYWDGYALKYHAWKRLSSPYNPTVIGYDTLNRNYQVVSWTPMVSFPAKVYITNVVEIQFLTSSTMRLYYYSQPRPTYTIPQITTTTTVTTPYYTQTQVFTSTDAQVGFLTNVILPLVIVSIPSLLLALYLGTSGLLIGLLIGGGILFYGGFAPFGFVFLIILGTVVLLWRGSGKSEEAK